MRSLLKVYEPGNPEIPPGFKTQPVHSVEEAPQGDGGLRDSTQDNQIVQMLQKVCSALESSPKARGKAKDVTAPRLHLVQAQKVHLTEVPGEAAKKAASPGFQHHDQVDASSVER